MWASSSEFPAVIKHDIQEDRRTPRGPSVRLRQGLQPTPWQASHCQAEAGSRLLAAKLRGCLARAA